MRAVNNGKLSGGFDFDSGGGVVLEYEPDQKSKPRPVKDKFASDAMHQRQKDLTDLRSVVLYCELRASKLLTEGHEITRALMKTKELLDALKASLAEKEKPKKK